MNQASEITTVSSTARTNEFTTTTQEFTPMLNNVNTSKVTNISDRITGEKVQSKSPFVCWPAHVMFDDRLGDMDKKVLYALELHRNKKTGGCFPSMSRLSKMTGIHRTHISKSTAKLESVGYIKRNIKKRSATRYDVSIGSDGMIEDTSTYLKPVAHSATQLVEDSATHYESKVKSNNYVKPVAHSATSLESIKNTECVAHSATQPVADSATHNKKKELEERKKENKQKKESVASADATKVSHRKTREVGGKTKELLATELQICLIMLEVIHGLRFFPTDPIGKAIQSLLKAKNPETGKPYGWRDVYVVLCWQAQQDYSIQRWDRFFNAKTGGWCAYHAKAKAANQAGQIHFKNQKERLQSDDSFLEARQQIEHLENKTQSLRNDG